VGNWKPDALGQESEQSILACRFALKKQTKYWLKIQKLMQNLSCIYYRSPSIHANFIIIVRSLEYIIVWCFFNAHPKTKKMSYPTPKSTLVFNGLKLLLGHMLCENFKEKK